VNDADQAEFDIGIRRRWVLRVYPLVSVFTLVTLVLLQLRPLTGVPGALPDPCTLVPAPLLAQVVPSPQESNQYVDLSGSQHVSRCFESSDVVYADPEPEITSGALDLTLSRFGASFDGSGGQRARADFTSTKQHWLAGGLPVRDIAGLGDSAYVVLGGVTSSDGSHLFAAATVGVLFGNADVDVSYTAGRSTTPLAMSAAVSVARTLIGQLR
jgi:hypothetical protein